jgi:thiosulfate/3-mercaptopyruvate sulfurtransferase
VVIDVRAAERYAGTVEPMDARAGHIPGAVNLPYAGNLDQASGRFLEHDALAARYRAAGVDAHDHVIVYCGSGVTACHAALAIERAGLPPARLYAGSWSQWSADDQRPIATGHNPWQGDGERQRAGGRGPQGEGERQRAGGRGPQGEGERQAPATD